MASDPPDPPFLRSVGTDFEAAIEALRVKATELDLSDRDLALWLGQPTTWFSSNSTPMWQLAAGNIEEVLYVADRSLRQDW